MAQRELASSLKMQLQFFLGDVIFSRRCDRAYLEESMAALGVDLCLYTALSLEAMADRFHYTHRYFSRMFRKHTAVSFVQYLTYLRPNDYRREYWF